MPFSIKNYFVKNDKIFGGLKNSLYLCTIKQRKALI